MNDEDFKSWIILTPRERRGGIGFILFMMIYIIGYSLIQRYYNPEVKMTSEQNAQIKEAINSYESYAKRNAPKPYDLNQFDPNTVSKQALKEMGLPNRLISTWINFRESGYRFKTKEDLLNIHTMDSDTYQQLEPFVQIVIKEKTKFNRSKPNTYKYNKKRSFANKTLFSFDPNTISKDSLKLLNIPNHVKNSLINYRKSGGQFKSSNKMRDIYGMNDSIYMRLLPYIHIDSSNQIEKYNYQKSEETQDTEPINLNKADSITLEKIPGITAFGAKVIIERRDNIGGFHNVNQLYDDIFSLDSVAVSRFIDRLYADSSYQYINLQEMDFKKLHTNYYFDRNMTKMILNYFKKRDQQTHIKKFIENNPLGQERWERVEPYLIKG